MYLHPHIIIMFIQFQDLLHVLIVMFLNYYSMILHNSFGHSCFKEVTALKYITKQTLIQP